MTDTPADPPPWITGPPPDYDPPPADALADPAVQQQTAAVGRERVLAVLAEECGIRKTERGWTRDVTTEESNQ